ncbi:hypothetical protein [Amycolatopsis sp. MJM2582]|uniref:hypothetical protein n=1 Tax=Amycolatopsis sp. MJM2582 TaxID=1427749 RepID=UPI00126A4076|nr:hypothetical protein [Amycolatopsis sp. MJM2582]
MIDLANIDARDNGVSRRIGHHLWIEPGALTRSIRQLRTETATDNDLANIATELESDAEASAEALSKPRHEITDKTGQVITFYLVKEVQKDLAAQPIDEKFRIVSRCPRMAPEFGFSAGRTTKDSQVAAAGVRIGFRVQARRQDLLAEPTWERTRPKRVGRMGFQGHTRNNLCAFRSVNAGDTFWQEERFVRKVSSRLQSGAFPG